MRSTSSWYKMCCNYGENVNICRKGSITGTVIKLWVVGLRFKSQQGQDIFHFSRTSRSAPGSIQPPIPWALEFFSGGWGGSIGGMHMQLTTHLHLVPRCRMSRSSLLLLLCVFMVWTGTLYFYIYRNENFGVLIH